jgi:hypothetical protein
MKHTVEIVYNTKNTVNHTVDAINDSSTSNNTVELSYDNNTTNRSVHSGPALTAHGSLDLKQEIQVHSEK